MLYTYAERESFSTLSPFKAMQRSIFLSIECFTGGFIEEPKTSTGMALQGVSGFCMLGFVSIYTAALTSILIEEAIGSVAINSMENLQTAGSHAIMFQGDPLKPRISAQYPWLIPTEVPRSEILATTNIKELLNKYNSKAVIVATPDSETIVQGVSACDATTTGVVLYSGGGFITNYNNCHADLSAFFDSILLGMEANGTIDEISSTYKKENCDPTASASTVDYSIALGQTAGIFLVAVFVLFIAYGKHFLHVSYSTLKTKNTNNEQMIGSVPP